MDKCVLGSDTCLLELFTVNKVQILWLARLKLVSSAFFFKKYRLNVVNRPVKILLQAVDFIQHWCFIDVQPSFLLSTMFVILYPVLESNLRSSRMVLT